MLTGPALTDAPSTNARKHVNPELCAVRQEEDAGGGVVKLTSIVALDSFDSPAELSRHIDKEIRQSSEGVRFKFQGKVHK
jgi:hypothetical protein